MNRWPRAAIAVYLVVLAFGVWTPQPPPTPLDPQTTSLSVEGLVADAVRNLFLFLPFGWLLAACAYRLFTIVGLGLVLSISIECLQAALPGRFTSLTDVVTNTLGTALGAQLFTTRRRWLTPDPTVAARLALGCFAGASAILVGAVQLMRPSAGGSEVYAGLRPVLDNYELYGGEVLDFSIGEIPLKQGRIGDRDAFDRAWTEADPITLRAQPHPSTGATAPLVTVHDERQREILVIAAQSSDLIVEARALACDLGLEQPMHRWPAALAGLSTSEVVEFQVVRDGSSASLRIADHSLGRRSWTPGSVWQLLIPGRIVPAALEPILNALTIGLLALPFSFYARRRLALTALFALLLIGLSLIGPVGIPAPADWIGLAAGTLVARLGLLVCTRRPGPKDSFDEGP